jgi:hypothetical protein
MEMESAQLKVRTRAPLRALIETAARERGVTLNEEINDRLQASFDEQRRIDEVFGDEQLFLLAKIVACTVQTVTLGTQRNHDAPLTIFLDTHAFDRAAAAVNGVLKSLRPSAASKGGKLPRQRVPKEILSDIERLVGGKS